MPLFSIGLMQSKVHDKRVCSPWIYRSNLHDSHESGTCLILFIYILRYIETYTSVRKITDFLCVKRQLECIQDSLR